MENEKRLSELVDEVLMTLIQRGQSNFGVANYRYIYNVFQAFSSSHHEDRFSHEVLECCLRDHYGITDHNILSHKQHHKKKVLRAYRLLRDHAEGKPFADRYTDKDALLGSQEHIDAATAFREDCQKKGRSLKTLDSYQRYVSQFLDFAEKCGVPRLCDISFEIINQYTLTLSGFSKHTVKGALSPLRIFLRFLHTNEYTEQDLSSLVNGISIRSQTKIPSVWAKGEVLELLDAIDRGNPSGKRDYAIILLVARLGVRIGDVNNLKFENIDWRKNSIEFIQKKTHNPIRLPLLKDVGWAIIDYVQNGRPQIDSPFVFLTHVPPFKGYADENHLYATIDKYLRLTNIQNQPQKKRGMHSLRHSLANRLLENRESTHTISSALGHSSPDSASAYLKTDIELLRECALSLPEVGI